MTNGNLPDTLCRAENFAFDLFRKLHPETRFKPWYIEVYQEAADELEKLRAERDAAVEDMRGICYLCKKAEPVNIGLRTLKTCEHLKERKAIATNKRPGCPHFEWRGPQKEGQ